MRRTARGAHESNLPFLASALTFDALMAFIPFVLLFLVAVSTLVQGTVAAGADPNRLFEPFLPPHQVPNQVDPLAGAEALLVRIATQGGRIGIVAVPLFLWFSTRLFAGIRGSLNLIYGDEARHPAGGVILSFIKGKVRDAGMVLVALSLLLVHSTLSGSLAVLTARGSALAPNLRFLVSSVGQLVFFLLAFGFLVALFLVLYRYASFRPLEWRGALVASLFSASAFELAKRLFGLYLTRVITLEQLRLDANIIAILLVMLWMWYTAFVFLLGAVVADTWEHPDRSHRPTPLLS